MMFMDPGSALVLDSCCPRMRDEKSQADPFFCKWRKSSLQLSTLLTLLGFFPLSQGFQPFKKGASNLSTLFNLSKAMFFLPEFSPKIPPSRFSHFLSDF